MASWSSAVSSETANASAEAARAFAKRGTAAALLATSPFASSLRYCSSNSSASLSSFGRMLAGMFPLRRSAIVWHRRWRLGTRRPMLETPYRAGTPSAAWWLRLSHQVAGDGQVVAHDDRAHRHEGGREGGDLALAHHQHHLLHRKPHQEGESEHGGDGVVERFVLLRLVLVLEAAVERVVHRLGHRIRHADLGHHRRGAADERHRDVRHRRRHRAGEDDECRVPGQSRHHHLVLPLLEALRDAFRDRVAVLGLVAGPGGHLRRLLDEALELRAVEAARRAQRGERVDLQVLELGLQLPHVVREADGVEHRVVEVLVLLSDLVAGLLVVLVRDLRRHEPGRNELRDRLAVAGMELRLVLDRERALPLRAQLQAVREELQVPEDLDEREPRHRTPSLLYHGQASASTQRWMRQRVRAGYSSRWSRLNWSMAALVSGAGLSPTAASSCFRMDFTASRFSSFSLRSATEAIASRSTVAGLMVGICGSQISAP